MSGATPPSAPPPSGKAKSPSLLVKAPTRGAGVRRLNARPLLVAGAGLGLALAAAGYTYHERQLQAAQHSRNATSHTPEAADATAALKNAPNGEYIPAAMHYPPLIHPLSGPRPLAALPSDTGAQGEDDATKARREAWKAYYARIAEIEKARQAAEMSALSAETGLGNGAQGGGLGGGQVSTASGQPQAQMVSPEGAAPGQGMAPGGIPGYGGGGGLGGYGGGEPARVDGNSQRQKQVFLNQPGDTSGLNDDLRAVIRDPSSPFLVMQGTAIPAITDMGINSDLPGQITAHVADPVYDSATGRYLLIPAGAKLIGSYDNMISQGQKRTAVIWHRIIFPDTSSISLGAMSGADQSGYAGFHDRVNTHLWEKLGNAALISIAAAGVQLAQGSGQNTNGYNSQQIAAAAIGQQFGELGQEYARAGLSIPNTLEIRPGYRFNVMVNKDIHLRPYVDRRSASPATNISFGPVLQ